MEENVSEQTVDLSLPDDCLAEAKSIMNRLDEEEIDMSNDRELNILDKYKRFIWFALPKDILTMKTNHLAIE